MDTDRQRYHIVMLFAVRVLVEEGVLGFAQPGDDVETVHGRFIRKDTEMLEAPEDDAERKEWRARELDTIEGMIVAQKDLLRSCGISVEKH